LLFRFPLVLREGRKEKMRSGPMLPKGKGKKKKERGGVERKVKSLSYCGKKKEEVQISCPSSIPKAEQKSSKKKME